MEYQTRHSQKKHPETRLSHSTLSPKPYILARTKDKGLGQRRRFHIFDLSELSASPAGEHWEALALGFRVKGFGFIFAGFG